MADAEVCLQGTGCHKKKRMNFRKSSKRGGVISNPKIYIADFGLLNGAF